MIYGVDIGVRRIAIAGPDYEIAVLRLSDPPTGTTTLRAKSEVHAVANFFAAVVPPEATFWVERPFMGRPNSNINTAIRLGMTLGGLFAVHAGDGYIVDQATWKAKVVGSGAADKDPVTTFLWNTDPASAEACGEDQDAIDACCIRRYGVMAASGELAESGRLPRRRPSRVLRKRREAADEPARGGVRKSRVPRVPRSD